MAAGHQDRVFLVAEAGCGGQGGGLYLGMSDKDPAGVGGGRLPVVSALRLKP